ncbi:MAG: hypothetical protein LBU34_18050 [Planctomycetaceae bacterium]|nr:hypothetical protein [Planctomycetaceae bacterium]
MQQNSRHPPYQVFTFWRFDLRSLEFAGRFPWFAFFLACCGLDMFLINKLVCSRNQIKRLSYCTPKTIREKTGEMPKTLALTLKNTSGTIVNNGRFYF